MQNLEPPLTSLYFAFNEPEDLVIFNLILTNRFSLENGYFFTFLQQPVAKTHYLFQFVFLNR